jgi:hypothetical protein
MPATFCGYWDPHGYAGLSQGGQAMDHESELNALSCPVGCHITLARNGTAGGVVRSWEGLSHRLIPHVLGLEAARRARYRLTWSPCCGTAGSLLSGIRDGSTRYSMDRGPLGRYCRVVLDMDCLDECRKAWKRRSILRETYPPRRAGAGDPGEGGLYGRIRARILAMAGSQGKVAALSWLDYWNLPGMFSHGELARIAAADAVNGQPGGLSQSQVARILGVGDATVSRHLSRARDELADLRPPDGDGSMAM